MKKKMDGITVFIMCCIILLSSGCSFVIQKGRRTDLEKIQLLEDELAALSRARSQLEKQLAQEMRDKQVSLSMEEKGLVITFVAEVLFDSGKAELRKESFPLIDKVAAVLKKQVPNNEIGIEGHTDNVPITHSAWKSNWELSAHRALSVLYHLESKGITSSHLYAVGYGEFRPVTSNDTSEGRQLNRRVEIVIVPLDSKRMMKDALPREAPSRSKQEELK